MAGDFNPFDPVNSIVSEPPAPPQSPLAAMSNASPPGPPPTAAPGMPGYGSALMPFGGTGANTLLDPDQIKKLMGALDDPEARRHKFIGALLQGTRSGSAGEGFGNAFSALGDFEQRQLELRMQYVPLMMREFSAYNSQVRDWYKFRAEQMGKWGGALSDAVRGLDPKTATTADVIQALNHAGANSDMPREFVDNYIVSYANALRNGMTPSEFITRAAAAGDPELRRSGYYPSVKQEQVGSAKVPVTEGRANIGMGSVPVGGGMAAVEGPKLEMGPNGPYYVVAGKPYTLGDPALPAALRAAAQSQVVPVPPPGSAAPAGSGPVSTGATAQPDTPPVNVLPPTQAQVQPPAPALPTQPVAAPTPKPATPPAIAAQTPPVAKAPDAANMPPPTSYMSAAAPWTTKNMVEADAGQAKEFQKELEEAGSHIANNQKLMQRLSLVEDVARQFRTGSISPLRAQTAGAIKDILITSGAFSPEGAQGLVQRIAGGDLAAYQMFNQVATTLAMVGARADLQGEGGTGTARLGQQEFLTYFGSKINPTMDPKAIFDIIQSVKDFSAADAQKQAAMNTWWNEYRRTNGGVKLNDFDTWWNDEMKRRNLTEFHMPKSTPRGNPYAPPENWVWKQTADGRYLAADPKERDPKTGALVWRTPKFPGVDATTTQRLGRGTFNQQQP